ncbi:hypothetical protein I553_1541 [Mycobacterium xenopi 4042]|uniref:Uncharacterized protein n=1 Tax=Mycobacterium xenopi 4042 TaxID=1299334 RepID=X8CFW4_MYCXE|nr:hypothetical protein I553_1541 [Mycobacterium xenopi 4042]
MRGGELRPGSRSQGAVSSLLAAARGGHGPGGASVASVANAIVTALATPPATASPTPRTWPTRSRPPTPATPTC